MNHSQMTTKLANLWYYVEIVLETLKSQKNTETHKNKDPYEKKHLCRDSKDENLTYGDDCLACEGQPPLGGPR